MSETGRSLIAFVIVMLVATGLAFGGSVNSQLLNGFPVFAICIIFAFVINWIVYIPSYINQTEKYFDLTGAITNTALPLIAVLLSPVRDLRSWLLLILIAAWAIRLGTFLFRRIQAAGHDDRFDALKTNWARYLMVWSLQGLWGAFTTAAALAAITSTTRQGFGIFAILGVIIWIIGFTIEITADNQKSRFRENPDNKGKFISTGLWAWSRHPNYFGEIVLWIGVAVIAIPVLSGWQWVAMISPIFVIVLLTRISGVPLLEAKADKKWGEDEAYQTYKANTPILIPRPPSS